MPLEEAFEGAPVLVTGGYGFIGSNLVRRLVSLGARVTGVDALVPNTGSLPSKRSSQRISASPTRWG